MRLTQAIFDGQPDWVRFAAIDKSGDTLGFQKDTTDSQDQHGWIVKPFWNKCVVIDDNERDSTAWQHSVIKRARGNS